MENSKKHKPMTIEVVKFTLVMLIFLIGMVILLINQVNNTWIWIAYIGLWTWAEAKIAGKLQLKAWHWVAVIIGILAIDLLVVYYLG